MSIQGNDQRAHAITEVLEAAWFAAADIAVVTDTSQDILYVSENLSIRSTRNRALCSDSQPCASADPSPQPGPAGIRRSLHRARCRGCQVLIGSAVRRHWYAAVRLDCRGPSPVACRCARLLRASSGLCRHRGLRKEVLQGYLRIGKPLGDQFEVFWYGKHGQADGRSNLPAAAPRPSGGVRPSMAFKNGI